MFRTVLPLSALAVLVSAGHPSAAAPAPARKPGLRLVISLDREAYLSYEPILVEWTVVNGFPEGVAYAPVICSATLRFECTDAKGNKREVFNPVVIDYATPPPFRPLGSRETVRRWTDLRDYNGLHGRGEFKIRAVCEVAYTPASKVEPITATLSSDETAFRVVEAQGADAVAVRCIEEHYPDRRVTAAVSRDRQADDTMRLESRRNGWRRNHELTDRLATRGSAGRFHVAASFYGAYNALMAGSPPGDEDGRQQWSNSLRRRFDACLSAKDSSHYMKGLSAYYLFLHWIDHGGKGSRQEWEKQAKSLIAKYPDTFIADECDRLLTKIRDRK